jgi:hypothetical protein
MATEAPFSVALVAPVDDQVRVELPPDVIAVGLAVREAVGPPPLLTTTVTVELPVAPDELVTKMV